MAKKHQATAVYLEGSGFHARSRASNGKYCIVDICHEEVEVDINRSFLVRSEDRVEFMEKLIALYKEYSS